VHEKRKKTFLNGVCHDNTELRSSGVGSI